GYPSPLVALPADRATKDAPLIKFISKKAKAPADAFTLAAYDALNVAATTLATTGPKADGASLREVFTHAADGYEGVTGTIELDPGPARDRVGEAEHHEGRAEHHRDRVELMTLHGATPPVAGCRGGRRRRRRRGPGFRRRERPGARDGPRLGSTRATMRRTR